MYRILKYNKYNDIILILIIRLNMNIILIFVLFIELFVWPFIINPYEYTISFAAALIQARGPFSV